MVRLMYDAVDAAQVPADAQMVAGYLEGHWPSYNALVARFPHARHVSIAIAAHYDAGLVLDVETGDATPAQAPGWVLMRRKAGVDPTVYCNTSTWPSVRKAFREQLVAEPHWWVAQYDGDPTIPAGAVAKQYRDPGPYDVSSVVAYWPGVDPAPVKPTPPPPPPVTVPQEDQMYLLTVARTGYTDLNWPGTFLFTSLGTLRHVVDPADLSEFEKLGLKSCTISKAQYQSLLAGK